jgi:carbon-monoxide dehydrogenase medium subunit
VINVKRIPELMGCAFEADGTLRLGAALCAAEITGNARLRETYPGLCEGVGLIGSAQIQSRASVGGNLCNASPAADAVPALVALGARAVIAGRGGSREVPVERFVTSPGRTVLAPDELLVALRIPPCPPRSADAYLRFIPRTEMDIAVVGAAVRIALASDGSVSTASVALGAVAPTVVAVPAAAQALVGSRLEDAALERAAEAARTACNPIDDKRGTAAYRRKVAGVLTVRAARIAFERAQARR